jgi:hypothetical protein
MLSSSFSFTILKRTTEIEYKGFEPSSTYHVLDARFSQANALQYDHSVFIQQVRYEPAGLLYDINHTGVYPYHIEAHCRTIASLPKQSLGSMCFNMILKNTREYINYLIVLGLRL